MDTKRIFVLAPYEEEFADVFDAVDEAAHLAGREMQQQTEVSRPDSLAGTTIATVVQGALANADPIIADTSSPNLNVGFEVGVARALDKPVIVITQRDSEVPFSLRGYYTLVYDRRRLSRDLVPHLAEAISVALRDPQRLAFWHSRQETRDISRAFVSYSHADRESLERLLVHLKPLQK